MTKEYWCYSKREEERDHLRQLEEAHSSNFDQNSQMNILET
jgi:hypothetical protein